MKQIALLLSAVISAATLVAAEEKASGGKVREADQRPNVLMICIDDLTTPRKQPSFHPIKDPEYKSVRDELAPKSGSGSQDGEQIRTPAWAARKEVADLPAFYHSIT